MIKYLIAIILVVPALILMFPLGIVMYIKPSLFSYKFRYKYVRILMRWLCFALRVKHHVKGLENIPKKGAFLITPNHQSFFDAVSFIAVMKTPFVYVAKKEVIKMPVIGPIVKVLGGFFIDRENVRQSIQLMKRIEEFMKNEQIGFVIFTEGTRTRDPKYRPGEFKGGSYKVAYKTQVPVIPTAITGTPRVLTLKEYLIHRVDIEFSNAISYENYKDMTSVELAALCQKYAEEKLKEFHKVNKLVKNDED